MTDLADFAGVETTTEQRFAGARRFAAYLRGIAGAGTASPAGPVHPTALACRRRPGHRPCPGFLMVRRSESPPQIEWRCPVCADEGLVYGWEGSTFDLSPPRESLPNAGAWLDPDQYRLLLTLPLDRDARRVVHAARFAGRAVLVPARQEELNSLIESVAAEAHLGDNPRRRQALEELVGALEAWGPGHEGSEARPEQSAPQTEHQRAGRGAAQHRVVRDRPRSIHQLKITLRHIRPPVWRRLQVPSDITLAQLHAVIQTAFGWDDYHLHDFEAGRQRYGVPHPEDFGPIRDERRVTLGGVAPRPGDRLEYQYDFGDSWIHRILVEAVLPAPAGPRLAVCLGGRRACPPEDCGGPWGYAELLAAIADKSHPDHEQMMEWAGPMDPERFSAQEVTKHLQRYRL